MLIPEEALNALYFRCLEILSSTTNIVLTIDSVLQPLYYARTMTVLSHEY